MFQTLVVQPIFNILVLIYAVLPGHNFGLAIILFTIVVRLCMWPLVKKQLHQAKAMRELQPEIKRIKQETKGDRQKESLMLMELYKERKISPFGSIGILIIQFIILIGLYLGLNKVVHDPKAFIDFSYPMLQQLPWLQTLANDITRFDSSLLGLVDLTKPAIQQGTFYLPAMLLVIGSAVAQYFQTVQIMPKVKDGRNLRTILKEASSGKTADQAEVSAAMSRSTRFLIPGMVLVFTVSLPSALSLYWLTGAIVAYIQQGRILKQDEEELEAVADKTPTADKDGVIEGEVIPAKPTKKPKKPQAKKSPASKKRRK